MTSLSPYKEIPQMYKRIETTDTAKDNTNVAFCMSQKYMEILYNSFIPEMFAFRPSACLKMKNVHTIKQNDSLVRP